MSYIILTRRYENPITPIMDCDILISANNSWIAEFECLEDAEMCADNHRLYQALGYQIVEVNI